VLSQGGYEEGFDEGGW